MTLLGRSNTYRYKFADKKIALFIFLQLIYFSSQIQLNKKVLTVMDCLAAAETGSLEKYVKNETFDKVVNYRARYILQKFYNSGRNYSSKKTPIVPYPYDRYRYAITNAIYTLVPNTIASVMIISMNCLSHQTFELKTLLEDLNHFVHCASLNTSHFNPIEILEDLRSFNIKMAILLLPRMIIQTLIEITSKFHVASFFQYITIDYVPHIIRQVRRINPLLRFSNLELFNVSDVLSYERLSKRIEQRECSLSPQSVGFHDDFHVLTCQHRSQRVIRIVTVFYEKHMFPLSDFVPHQNKCDLGLPCKVKSQGAEKTWVLICCAGRLIDKLTVVMKDVGYPFTIYIVEDGLYGRLKNGSWDGLVKDLYEGKADIAVARLSVTRKRSRVFNYVYERSKRTAIGILFRRNEVDLEFINFSFVPRGAQNLIVYLAATHLVVFIVVYIFEFIAFRRKYGQKYNFKDSWSFVGAIWFQRDLGGLATKCWSGRALAITYACAMTVLISSYTATLTAENIEYEDFPTFQGLRDKRFKDPSKRIGLFRYSSHEDIMDKYEHTCKRVNIESYGEGAKLILEGKLDAVIGSIAGIKRAVLSEIDYCRNLFVFSDQIESEDLAWGYNKKSKFGEMISLRRLHLMKRDDFNDIDEKWSAINSCNRKRPKQYPWQYAAGLIICLLGTTGICVVIIMLETFYTQLKKRKKRSCSISSIK